MKKTQNAVIENTENMKDVVIPEIRPVTEPMEIVFSSPDKIFEEKLVESDSHSQEKNFYRIKVSKCAEIYSKSIRTNKECYIRFQFYLNFKLTALIISWENRFFTYASLPYYFQRLLY